MILIDGTAKKIELGTCYVGDVIDFDFAEAMPYSIESMTASCGCTSSDYDRVGSFTQDGVTYPIYRIYGKINIGVPSLFARNPELKDKHYTKTITVFFKNEQDLTVHKTFSLNYKVLREKPEPEKQEEDV